MSKQSDLPYPHRLPRRIHLAYEAHERRRTTKQPVRDSEGATIAWITTYSDQTEIADFMVIAYNERRAALARQKDAANDN